jgi:hypothetical protein
LLDSAVVRRRLLEGPWHSYLRDFAHGAIDGAVTPFAIVAGATAASFGSTCIWLPMDAAWQQLSRNARRTGLRRRVRREEELDIDRAWLIYFDNGHKRA